MPVVVGLLPLACSDQGSSTVYTGNQISDYVATWDGYAEAFTFEDGSDRIRLRIAADGSGTIQVGDMALLPHPVDPAAATWNWRLGSTAATQLKPGFLYPIYGANVGTDRIRFGADFHDLYGEWCAAQTPYSFPLSDPPLYACVPNPAQYNMVPSDDGTSCAVTDSATGQPLSASCVTVMLCTSPPPCVCNSPYLCACDATACAIPPIPNGTDYPVKIDAALEDAGAKLVGTLATNDGYTRYTVRLTRQ
jgi:hypothetical protein